MTARTTFAIAWLAGVACAGCGGSHSEEEVTANAPVPVATESAARGTVEAVTPATAVIAAAPGAELIVIAPQPGRIARLPKGEGDAVRKGDLLAEFDIPSSQADVAAREAELTQARARLTTAQNALKRLQGLFERGVAARKEVEDAQREASDAQAAVTNGETARGAAHRLASRTTVVAPFNGIVAKRWHNPGDQVDAAAADPVLRVVDPARAEVTAAVPAAVANRVRPGQMVRIRSAIGSANGAGNAGGSAAGDAADAPFWQGSVLTRPTVVDPATATSNIRVAVRNNAAARAAAGGAPLPPIGTAVRADIITDVRKDAVTVPASAIVREDEKTFVYVSGGDKKAHRREVKVGVSSEAATEILSGVSAGDNVIVRGQAALPDGAAVRPEEPAEKAGEKGDEKGEKDDEKAGGKPAEKAGAKPGEKADQKPAEKAGEKPAEKGGEKPGAASPAKGGKSPK